MVRRRLLNSNPEFQFHSGSIKRNATLTQLNANAGFNSIVVRLKGGQRGRDGAVGERFQFHSGSIKRAEMSLNRMPSSKVSIP